MRASVIWTLALLAGCGIENNLGVDLPQWPDSIAPPVSDLTQTDVIVQVTTPKVDILWMIDNSCSMSNEQSDLTENFPYFMDYFLGSGLDYHIAITSSDVSNGSNYPGAEGTLVVRNGISVIETDTPNQVPQFQAMAGLGVSGRFPERGLAATYLALEVKVDTVNAGFYRDEAALHTIIISDEPDYTLASTITQPEYVDWYDGLKPETDMRTFSAIINGRVGTKYRDTAVQVGGIVWDLEQENWPALLEQLGLQAAGLKREYFLSQRPVPGTLEVSVETPTGAVLRFDEDEEYTYDPTRNSITFVEFIPEALSKVVLHYELLAAEQIEE